MALLSQLFRDDEKLKAAAVSDPDHVAPGTTGEHVSKIQSALIQLDGAAIEPDGQYGPLTAAAVLAYKRKRGIKRAGQTQEDNIVGILTMAALDREMLKLEASGKSIEIKPINPKPRTGARPLRSAFRIDLDFPVFPDGNLLKIRLAPRSTGTLEVVNGTSGKMRCTNTGASEGKISFIFDPDEPLFIPATRLNPTLRGPLQREPLLDGGTVRITNDPFTVKIDALHPGNAFIDATTAASANTLAVEVRAPKLASPSGFAPPTKTRPGSKFISAVDSQAGPKGARDDNGGRPVNPKGSGRKINIFGSQETPGFEDYTTDLHFSGFAPGKFQIATGDDTIFRPWTEDPDSAVGVKSGTASDICMRDSPVSPLFLSVVRRIAGPGCRLTCSFSTEGAIKFIPALKTGLPGSTILEEFPDAIVMELP